jgi:uncharacterized protein YegL
MASEDLPGGKLGPRRDVHFYWILDGSRSMLGEKIQSLNYAVARSIPEMRKVAAKHPRANILVRALRFATDAGWVTERPTPLSEFVWRDIEADGETSMGLALSMVCDELDWLASRLDKGERFFPPILILVTDGHPTDEGKVFEAALQRLLTHKVGESAIRLAIAIGTDVGPDGMQCLRRFINNPTIKPLEVTDLAALPRLISIMSRSAITISSKPSGDAPAKIIEEAAQSDGVVWTWTPSDPGGS